MSKSSGRSAISAFALGIRLMAEYPWQALLFLCLSLSQGALQGAFIWIVREVLVRFDDATTFTVELILGSSVAVLSIWLLRSVAYYYAEVWAARLSEQIALMKMLAVLKKLLRLSIRFFGHNSQGDLVMSSYNDLVGIRGVIMNVGRLIIYSAALAGLALAAWSMSPKLALIGFLVVPFGTAPAYLIGRRITDAAGHERRTVIGLYDVFLEVATGIQLIKVNMAEPRIYAKGSAVGDDVRRFRVDKKKGQAFAVLLLEAVSGVGIIVILMLGGRDVVVGTLEWQSMLGLLMAVLALFAPVKSILTVYNNMRSILPNIDRIDHILEEPEEITTAPNAVSLKRAPESIELSDVTFAYGSEPVLKNISFTVRRGETVGIVGHSGSGKSTLLSLLLRLYDPSSGQILFDGVDLRDISTPSLLRQCAMVMQEPFLFADTIANNIRVGNPAATMQEVEDAARAANIHDEIVAMELGYDTFLGRGKDSRGTSVGQKQRIAIAAAILKNAPILFMDEATSSLDSISEKKVQRAIDHLMTGRTTFIIAHRLSTLRMADRILVLDGGSLVGNGPHEVLCQTCYHYQELWRHQVGTGSGVDQHDEPIVVSLD